MIKSVTFDLHCDYNYIKTKKWKRVLRKGKTQKGYEKALLERNAMHMSERELKNKFFEEVEDGLVNPMVYKNLANRTIEFSEDKINVIYGPNASGKTTILRTIATHSLCGMDNNIDGFTSLYFVNRGSFFRLFSGNKEPFKYDKESNTFVLADKDEYDYYMSVVKKYIDEKAGNGAIVETDGGLVYYENFAGRRVTGTASDFEGTIMGSFGEALYNSVMSHSMSLGERSFHLFNQLIEVCSEGVTLDSLLNKVTEISEENPHYYSPARVMYDYMKNRQTVDNPKMTILLDEMDKSLDIMNVVALYRDAIPYVQEKCNAQIILISHNPLVLSSMLPEDKYNLISIDDEYTEEVRKNLKGITFN